MDLEVLKRVGNGSMFLIQFYGALYFDSKILIIMELMDSSIEMFCLKAKKLKVKLPEHFNAAIAFSVLSALSFMKKMKLIHRDVKPSNILINSDGQIKLCDFGISGITKNSICNSYKGCQLYMAVLFYNKNYIKKATVEQFSIKVIFFKPEKIRISEIGYNIKSDIWSLGISLVLFF
jgi:mitogen-activated protein kinase kinase 4